MTHAAPAVTPAPASPLPPPPPASPSADSVGSQQVGVEDFAKILLPATAPRFLGYRRYQGTVNGQPVLVELQLMWEASIGVFSCEATYYFPAAGGIPAGLDVAPEWSRGQPLDLTTADQQHWCATQPLGPVLSGSCWTRTRQLLGTFALHESYAGAVRYEILEETAPGRAGTDAFGEPDTASVTLQYLHLLGRDTLRPALARVQCPRPAQRRRAQRVLAAELTPTATDFAAVYQESQWVTLNEADLLSYHTSLEESVMKKRHGEHSGQQVVLDLRTGRELDVLAQLRPGGLLALQRLLGRQARRDTAAAARLWEQEGVMDEPEEGFVLTPAGWEAHIIPRLRMSPSRPTASLRVGRSCGRCYGPIVAYSGCSEPAGYEA